MLRRIFWISLITAIVVAIGAAGFAYAYKDRVIPILTEELNKHLITDVQVASIDFSLLDRFPYASVRFNEVTAKAAFEMNGSDTLFSAQRVYLSFNIIDVIEGRYDIRSIELQGGTLTIGKKKDGSFNYNIWKSDTAATSNNVSFHVEEMVLRKIELNYIDLASNNTWQSSVNKLVAKGSYDPEEMSLAAYGSIRNKLLIVDGEHYLDEAEVGIDIGIEVFANQGRVQFSRGGLTLKGSSLEVRGTADSDDFNLDISGQDIRLEEVVNRLPQSQKAAFQEYQISGEGDINLSISNEGSTQVEAHFTLRNTKATLPDPKVEFRNVAAKGSYVFNNGQDELRLDTFNLEVFKNQVSGNGVIRHLEKPQWNLWVYGSADLSELVSLTELNELKGQVNFSGTSKGRQYGETLDIHDFIAANNQFKIDADKISNGPDWTLNTSSLTWKGHALSSENTSITYKGQDLLFSGFVNHIFFALNDKETLHIQGDLTGEKFTWEQNDSGGNFEWPNRVKGSIKLKIGAFSASDFTGSNLLAECRISPYSLRLSPFSINNSGGIIKGAIEVRPLENGGLSSQGHVEVASCDIPMLMNSFDQFGQDNITSKNLEGSVTATVDYTIRLDSNLEVIRPLITADAHFSIVDGVLIEYEPLISLVPEMKEENILVRLINLDDFDKRLRRIEFGALENDILIRNQTVTLPLSTIESSALDLEVAGKTTFDFGLDFSLKFNLKSILTRNEVKHTEYGYIVDDGTGNKMVFLNITGTVDEPIISFNRSAGKKNRQDKLNDEITTTKSILNEELGLFKNDTTLEKIDEKVEEIQYELELEGWSEEEGSTEENEGQQQVDTTNQSTTETPERKEKGWRKLWKEISEEEESEGSSFEFD